MWEMNVPSEIGFWYLLVGVHAEILGISGLYIRYYIIYICMICMIYIYIRYNIILYIYIISIFIASPSLGQEL